MRKLSVFCFILAVVAFASSCSTNPGKVNTGVPSQPLIPLQTGYQWIYVDTLFSTTTAGAVDTVYADTLTVNNQELEFGSSNGNVTFYGVTESDTGGIFGVGNYIGLDPSNTAIYEYDTAAVYGGQPYVYFETASADGTFLGQGSQTDPNNPSCTDALNQYGYITPTTIAGKSCLKNVIIATNCSGQTVEQDIIYIDPGIGLVRFEDWTLNSAGTSLVLDFSQTLVSDNLN